jgi:hypothetical protein
MKTSLSDYKTATLKLEIDGKEGIVVINSLSSRAWTEAVSCYQAAMTYAKDNKIPTGEDIVEQLGFKHEGKDVTRKVSKKTKFANDAYIVLMSKLVKEWPFDMNVIDALNESEELLSEIDVQATSLRTEFNAKKKT